MIGAIAAEVTAAQGGGSRAIILRSGLRHFSAGADVAQFDARIGQGSRGESAIGGVDFLKLLELLPIPIVASVHGVCLGGGFELALACDYIVAASSAKIGSVEVTLGLHPLLGGVQRQVQRAGAMRAKELSMLGRRYDPATLERWGLVNLVVADDAIEEATMTIAQELAPRGIRVNGLAPGATRTPINTDAWSTPEAYEALMRLVPYKRIGEPEDIARTAVWLASDEADYVTGANIYVDGGMTLYPGFEAGG